MWVNTLQGTNISPKNGILKMIFLFPRWDMLIPWRVSISVPMGVVMGAVSWKFLLAYSAQVRFVTRKLPWFFAARFWR